MDNSSKLQLLLQNQKNGLVYQHLKNIKDGDNVEDIENVKDVVLNENSCRTKVKCSFCEQLLNHSKKMSVTDIINKVAAKIAFLDEPIKVSVFVFNSSFNHGIYAKDVLVTSGMLLSDGGGRANEK
ncbi:18891_t:CDS:2 [Entrophospora sp. SA101]|nr:18891_t:CDS:2 [Entrophospora sp. SA101]